MLMLTLVISCLTTSNLPWFMDLTFQVPIAILLFTASDLASITSPIHNWVFVFFFGFIPSFFLELFLHWSQVSYWAPTDLGNSSFNIRSFCLFILFMGFLRQEYWSGVPFPSSGKMMLWKCCTQYASKFGKHSSGHRTGKGQFSFQSQRKEMPKNVQTTAQLHSPHMLVNAQNSPGQDSAICELWTSRCSSWFNKRQRNQRSNCQHLLDHQKSKRVPEKHIFLLYWLCQSLWLWGSE